MTIPSESELVDGLELERLLDERDLFSLVGSHVVSARSLSRFRAATAPRSAWRVDLADGRRVKLRRLKAGDTGRRLAAVLETVDSNDFARIVACRGRLVVEEWIEGTPIDAAHIDSEAIRLAGNLLGRLHTVLPLQEISTDDDRIAIETDLERLCEAGMMRHTDRARVLAMIGRHDPSTTTRGTVHGDFCGENLVLSRDGRLRSIDNEDMAAGSVDGDLIRSLERWHLAPAQQEIFLAGYRDFRDPAAALGASPFWLTRSRAHSGRVRSAAGDSDTARAHVRALADLTGVPLSDE